MKPTVYIETTIVSYLTAWPSRDLIRLSHEILTQTWWRDSRHRFELFTSELVLAEAAKGDPKAAAERLGALTSVALVPGTDQAGDLADALLSEGAIPLKSRTDALHLAIAATNGLNFLLTWNCRHLANAVLGTRITEVCRRRGFEPPIICTPYQLAEV